MVLLRREFLQAVIAAAVVRPRPVPSEPFVPPEFTTFVPPEPAELWGAELEFALLTGRPTGHRTLSQILEVVPEVDVPGYTRIRRRCWLQEEPGPIGPYEASGVGFYTPDLVWPALGPGATVHGMVAVLTEKGLGPFPAGFVVGTWDERTFGPSGLYADGNDFTVLWNDGPAVLVS